MNRYFEKKKKSKFFKGNNKISVNLNLNGNYLEVRFIVNVIDSR